MAIVGHVMERGEEIGNEAKHKEVDTATMGGQQMGGGGGGVD